MKLFDSTNLYYILFSVITYIIVGLAFYLVVEHVIYDDVEERLRVERRDFENFTASNPVWNESCYFVENKIEVAAVSDTLTRLPVFKDTLLYNRYSKEYVPFREHNFYRIIGTTPYKVSIRKSLIESNKLLKSITGTMLIVLCFGLLTLFFFQGRVAQHIWEPFYRTLARAKSFEVNEGKGLVLAGEKIFEFNELNSVLNKMTDKIAHDYTSLKEFTENASHEIQTPLALITSRIEELIQQKNFSDQQMRWIQDIYQSCIRLSKLHHALLLLSKIENGQFFESEVIDLSKLVHQKIQEFEEFATHKNVTIQTSTDDTFSLAMSSTLADILLTNLVNNALKHNVSGGNISIRTTSHSLTIANTGAALTTDPQRLFERFKKQNQASGSLGLGLAIVKKICDNYHLDIEYAASGTWHTLTITKK